MSHLPWQPAYRRSHALGGDDQIEALQTDVMRFMAILGLCLMAIFSIVQSLPYQAVQKTPQLESKALLESEIQHLQRNLVKMLDKISHLEISLQQALEKVGQAIKAQQGRLNTLKESLQQEQQTLATVRKKLLKEQKIHTQQQLKLDEVSKTKAIAEKKPAKQGFSLRFTSNQALLHLLQQQDVKLYLMMGKQAWRIKGKAGHWQLTKTQLPKQYYQMAMQTVPSVLRQVAQKQLSVHSQSQVIWAVELPQSIAESIASLMKKQVGGALLIEQNGEVLLK